jgi:hypothetical protein
MPKLKRTLDEIINTPERTRRRKPHGNIKVDEEILVSAVQQGMPQWKAAQMAGSKAKTKDSLKEVAQRVLYDRKTGSTAFVEKLKLKQDMILNAMTSEKADSESFRHLAQALGIINERIRLIEGKSTENKAVVIRWDDGSAVQTEQIKEAEAVEPPPQLGQ